MNALHESAGHRIAHHVVSCKGGFVPENPESMLNVLAQCDDFKILEPIVGFDPVLVIDSHLGRNPDEGLGHESVRIPRVFLAADAKYKLFIAIGRINIAPKDAWPLALVSDDPAHGAEVADLIEIQILDGSPLLHTCNPTTEYMQ